MIGRIVQIRQYVGKPNKFIVVEITDDTGLYDAVKHYDGAVVLDVDYSAPEEDDQ